MYLQVTTATLSQIARSTRGQTGQALPGTACSRNWPVCAQVWSILRTDVFFTVFAHAHVRELTGFMWSAIGSSGYHSVRLAILALGSTRRMKTGHQNTTGRLVYLCFISNPIRFVLPLHYVCHSPCSTSPPEEGQGLAAPFPPRTLILLSPDSILSHSATIWVALSLLNPKLLSVLSIAWKEAAGHQTHICGGN